MNDKAIYDKIRYAKIKEGTWAFNKAHPDKLSALQKDILVGGLLGDFHLYKYKNQINAGLAIGRASSDREYLEYHYNLFKDFCQSNIIDTVYNDKRTGKTYSKCSFRTQTNKCFTQLRNEWYPDGTKHVPTNLKISPTVMATWFCDDGSIVSSGKTGKTISLYTDSFLKNEVDYLQSIIRETIDVPFRICRKKSTSSMDVGYYLVCSKRDDVVKFISYIQSNMPESMSRKSDKWKDWI